jgi:hypothetical protein
MMISVRNETTYLFEMEGGRGRRGRQCGQWLLRYIVVVNIEFSWMMAMVLKR